MSYFVLVFIVFLLFSSSAFCADVPLKWTASPGATGYKLEKSIDGGLTWGTPVDVGNVTSYVWVGVEEQALILFRATAYNLNGVGTSTWAGAWYDHRKKPPAPASGLGIE